VKKLLSVFLKTLKGKNQQNFPPKMIKYFLNPKCPFFNLSIYYNIGNLLFFHRLKHCLLDRVQYDHTPAITFLIFLFLFVLLILTLIGITRVVEPALFVEALKLRQKLGVLLSLGESLQHGLQTFGHGILWRSW